MTNPMTELRQLLDAAGIPYEYIREEKPFPWDAFEGDKEQILADIGNGQSVSVIFWPPSYSWGAADGLLEAWDKVKGTDREGHLTPQEALEYIKERTNKC
ncbi:hypothetical protein [Faecalibaculum rodentium]|uniref:hypothetical protein n=1 Tax=Faecalibaculum rodentium TaxID=1702221 RepID=UPI002731A000|nr:hypothetical protein [Faecalibaculum rodentium]